MKNTVGLATFTFTVLLAASLGVAEEGASGKTSSTRPPRDLKKVGDHWTPWDPPTPGPDDYIIQQRDTLWDLSAKWLGDPFLWPQIWDQNRYIQDSHWIYPGDPLVRPGQPTVVPPSGPPEGEVGAEPEVPAPSVPAAGPPSRPAVAGHPRRLFPLAAPKDIQCSGYIDPRHEFSKIWIAGRETERRAVATGDVVYLNQGRNQGVVPGADYAVIRKGRAVLDPDSEEALGEMIARLGKLRVLCVQDETSTAVVVDACDAIEDSDEVVPWTEIPVPQAFAVPSISRCEESSGGPQGKVVAIKDVSLAGTGHVIYADLDGSAGVRPGDFLTVYRDRGDLPRLVIGQAMVLTVGETSCAAKVVSSRREMGIGDRVEMMR